MKKSLIALAVAGTFAAPVAMADTTIYGAANVSIDFVDSGSSGNSASQISSNASAIGFKGSEDLGGGTSAIWQIESNVNLDNSGNGAAGGVSLGGNASYAGLTGSDWGTIALGQLASPYKMATRGLDVFADTIADNRGLTGPLDLSNWGYLPDTIAYMSPNMSGVSVAAAIVAGAETPISGATKGSAYSLNVMYGAGPINAAFAYQSVTLGSSGTGDFGSATPDDKLTAWTLGGGYTMDPIQVNLSYERRTYDPNVGSSADQNDWYLAGKYMMGGDALKLAYTSVGKWNSQDGTDANQISVGYDHSLSKNTTVYALYTVVNNKDNASYGLGNYDGITGTVGAAAPGSDPHAWSLGMKHSF